MRFTTAPHMERARNFANNEVKCMNCSKIFVSGHNVYDRRFCSEACRQEYFSQ